MRAERGVVLILFAMFAMIFILFAALAIGLAMVAYSKSEAQIIGNAVALAALEGWVHETQGDRMTAALSRANLILQRNKISGLRDPSLGIGQLYPAGTTNQSNFAGDIAMGRLYPRNPGTDPAECLNGSTAVYPCLVYYEGTPPSNAKINAVRVRLQIGSYNAVLAPFVPSWLGSSLFSLNLESTATAVERCTTFLLDVSMSTTFQTHRNLAPNWAAPPQVSPAPSPPVPALMLIRPKIPAMYAYRNGSFPSPASFDCSSMSNFTSGTFAARMERLFRCSTRPQRVANPSPYPWDGTWPTPSPSAFPAFTGDKTDPDYPTYHFWDDYVLRDSRYGPVIVDNYVDPSTADPYQGPEPLRTYLDAMNLALRTLKDQQTSMDLVSIKAFTGRRIDEIPPSLSESLQSPPPSPSPPSFTNDLGYAIQVTNYLNIGVQSLDSSGNVVNVAGSTLTRPNFLDHGWFPLIIDSSVEGGQYMGNTNMVELLDESIDEMSQYCPKNAKKQIVLMSDGINSCTYTTHSSSTTRNQTGSDSARACGQDYSFYLGAENQIFAGSGDPFPNQLTLSNGENYPSIIQRLRDQEIAVTILLSGEYVQPNFMNIQDMTPPSPLPAVAPSPYPLDYLEAMGLGFTALPPAGYSIPGYQGISPSFFATDALCPDGSGGTVSCTDQEAYDHIGQTNYFFRRANVLGRLSILTGGLWCPLAPLDRRNGAYDHGIHMLRPIGQPETYAYLEYSPRRMASECASQAVGYNPYILSEPLRTRLNGT